MAELFAVRWAFVAFAATLIRGAIQNGGVMETVQAGLVLMAVGYGAGWIFGEISRQMVEEQAKQDFERLKQIAAEQASRSAQAAGV